MCLSELSEALEKFYSRLDVPRLRSFASTIELWRPHFPHPDRVPLVLCDPAASNPDVLAPSDNPAAPGPIQPFEPARHSLARLSVQDLPISARARNVLRVAEIRTVNELAQIRPSALIRVGNCGRRTIVELANLLQEYFASLPSSGIVFYQETRPSWLRAATSSISNERHSHRILFDSQERTVMEVIESVIAKLEPRTVSILTERMGLSSGRSRKTLEAIGREFHLTRERVRQIADKGLQIISRHVRTRLPDLFTEIQQFIGARGVVSLDDVIAIIPNLGTSDPFDSKAGVRVLLLASQDGGRPLDATGNAWCSREITPAFHRQVLKAARRILKGVPMRCVDVSVEVAMSLRQFDDLQMNIIRKLLLNSPSELTVERSPEGDILCPPRQNTSDRRRSFIYAYIKEQGVPVQMQEIFAAIQDSMPELIPDSPTRQSAINTVASGLDRDDRFAWAGSSTWGLREWGYVSRGASVAAAILETLRASGVPLSAAQIRKQLAHLYRVSPAGISVALKSAEGVTIEKNSQSLWRLL